MSKTISFLDRLNNWARRSVMLKLLIIGFLMLILMIPTSFVQSLIYERQGLRDDATREVSGKWGGEQTISGPVISVPYESTRVNDEGKTVITGSGYVHFLPDEINIKGDLNPEKRQRGIYVVVLYNTTLAVNGSFGELNVNAIKVPESDIQWENALMTIGISDMKGIQRSIEMQLNDASYTFGPGTVTRDILASGASFPIDLNENRSNLNFSYELDINGSTNLYFTPFGETTNVTLASSWPDPKFEGASLPDERDVTDEGFTAHWSELHLNRNYPQQGVGRFIMDNPNSLRFGANAFGVKLLLPIDEYKKTNRSTKYASFFIFITFLTFFFIEVLNRKRLHPIQYLLVGAAIILFYILLLSISEHLTFDWAYMIGCVTILILITGYCWFVFKNRKLTFMVFGLLAILYGFFYSLMQLQDYSLLLGSIGLLIILATIMYMTRSIDWYDLRGDDDA